MLTISASAKRRPPQRDICHLLMPSTHRDDDILLSLEQQVVLVELCARYNTNRLNSHMYRKLKLAFHQPACVVKKTRPQSMFSKVVPFTKLCGQLALL